MGDLADALAADGSLAAGSAASLLVDEFVHGPSALRRSAPKSFLDALVEATEPNPPRPWRARARAEQLPPEGLDWLTWLLLAGRGFGKSFTGSNVLAEWATEDVGDYAAIGPTFGDTRKIMTEGPSGLIKALGDDLDSYNKSDFILYLRNGSRILLASADVPDRVRGTNLRGAWLDELAAMRDSRVLWDEALLPALRIGDRPRVVITTTPKRSSPVLVELLQRAQQGDESVFVTRGRTLDNAANLSPAAVRALYKRYGGTSLGQQELEGQLLEDAEGALLNSELISRHRVYAAEVPELRSVVVAVDPAVTAGPTSDYTGIVVVGVGPAPENWTPPGGNLYAAGQDHLYVLQDRSVRMTPEGWAATALAAAEMWAADSIVAEVNQGGLMVRSTLEMTAKAQGYALPYVRMVHASRGKLARAEPLIPLAEQGRFHMVGQHSELETEWTTWVPSESKKSPDRLDANVWGAVALMPLLGMKVETEVAILA